jgi:NDP-sugar pyrophosphorylase family protein
VLSFEEKPANPRTNFANAGIHVAGRELKEYLPDASPADLGFHVLPQLVGKMFAYVTSEYIQDIGSPESYAKAQHHAATSGLPRQVPNLPGI